jgi:hypothetical protein
MQQKKKNEVKGIGSSGVLGCQKCRDRKEPQGAAIEVMAIVQTIQRHQDIMEMITMYDDGDIGLASGMRMFHDGGHGRTNQTFIRVYSIARNGRRAQAEHDPERHGAPLSRKCGCKGHWGKGCGRSQRGVW